MKFKNITTLAKTISLVELEKTYVCTLSNYKCYKKNRCNSFCFILKTKCRQGFKIHTISKSGKIIHCIGDHIFCKGLR